MSAPAPAPTLPHVVARGETLAAIAEGYNVPVAKLRQANPALARTRDDDEIDRARFRTVAVPRSEQGTKVQGLLSHDKQHDLEAPHRLAVLYATAGSDLTGLFDVVGGDGEIVHDKIYGRFDIHYVAPEGVPSLHFAAGLCAADDPPYADFPSRGGYCAPGLPDLKKRGAGGGGEPITKEKLEASFKKEGRALLSSGAFDLRPGKNVLTVRIVIADEAAAEEKTPESVMALIPWAKIPIAKLSVEKRYRLAVVASNGGTAVDAATSGDIHMVRVSLEVELPEVAPGVPAERALEVRLHPPGMAPTDLVHREEDEAIQYCTDSAPLARDVAKYKAACGDAFLGEKVFTAQEEYAHATRKVRNDTSEHKLFRLPEGGGEVEVPPHALLKVLALGKKVLDQVTEDDRPEKGYQLKFQPGFYPYIAEYLRVHVFHRDVEPRPGASEDAVEAAEKDLERAGEEVKRAETAVRELREQALAAASAKTVEERRIRRRHAQRSAAERALAALRARKAVARGGETPPRTPPAAGATPAQDRDLDYAVARAEERLRLLWTESRADLEKAAARAREATTPQAQAERRERAAREARAAEDLRAAKARAGEAEKAFRLVAALKLGEIVPIFSAGEGYDQVASRIQLASTTVVAVIDDGFEKLHSARVDGERTHRRGEAKRSIAESFDGTYLAAGEGLLGGGFAATGAPTIEARWGRAEARVGERVALEAELASLPPGVAVTFDVYRGESLVETLTAESGVASARAFWGFARPERAEDGGEATFTFAVKAEVDGATLRGRSGPLAVFDSWEVPRSTSGESLAGRRVEVTLSSGAVKTLTLDARGYGRLDRVPPGPATMHLLPPEPPATPTPGQGG